MATGDNIIGGGSGYVPPPPPPPAFVPILKRLADDALALSVTPPSFQALTADTLGNAATETDGFDVALQDIALALESESDGLSALDGDLADAGFTLGEFGAAFLDPAAADIGTAVASGDAVVTDLVSSIGDGTQAIPPVTPPVITPTGGGGTGGSGAGGGGPLVGPPVIEPVPPFYVTP